MRTRFGITIAWMAAAFVLFGAALGFAQTGSNHGAERSATAKATPHGQDRAAEVRQNGSTPDTETQSENESHERKQNHGFFVSAAAHCEDVEGFTAPADCEDNGRAHGEYVSLVARSDLGRSDEAHGSRK
jgi:hypothetical protein